MGTTWPVSLKFNEQQAKGRMWSNLDEKEHRAWAVGQSSNSDANSELCVLESDTTSLSQTAKENILLPSRTALSLVSDRLVLRYSNGGYSLVYMRENKKNFDSKEFEICGRIT